MPHHTLHLLFYVNLGASYFFAPLARKGGGGVKGEGGEGRWEERGGGGEEERGGEGRSEGERGGGARGERKYLWPKF